MPDCKFTKKTLLHISFHVFCLHFSRMHHDYFIRRVCEYNFFQWKVVLLVIYLFNQDSFKPTIFLLNMSFEVLLSAVSCNIKLFALCFDRYFFIKTWLFSTMVMLIFYFDICSNQVHTFNNNLNEEGMI